MDPSTITTVNSIALIQGKIIYHGSLIQDITHFKPGSHFGSLEQALVCIGAHAFIDEHKPISPTIYKCQVNYRDSDIFHMSDWGTPNHQGTLRAYFYANKLDDEFKKISRTLQNSTDPEKLSLNLLKDAMLERGHKAISYENTVESKGTSIMILFPNDIRILETSTPSRNDIFSSFTTNLDKLRPSKRSLAIQLAESYRDGLI